eukprot:GHVS01090551.1.p1 GENE.GHVS01090551.1~~GHVS01090551.1.p1  ORF type:complete len:1396 (-),score=269.13 GHVS01090551.1:384-4412(-)
MVVHNRFFSPRIQAAIASNTLACARHQPPPPGAMSPPSPGGPAADNSAGCAFLFTSQTSCGEEVLTAEEMTRHSRRSDSLGDCRAPALQQWDLVVRQAEEQVVFVLMDFSAQNMEGILSLLREALEASDFGVIVRQTSMDHTFTQGEQLAGYGVELAIKSSEYKTVDEVGSEQAVLNPAELRPLEDAEEDEPPAVSIVSADQNDVDVDEHLSPHRLRSIGLQLLTAVRKSSSPLDTLEKLSCNFPAEAVRLSRGSISSIVRKSLRSLHRYIRPRASIITVNGAVAQTGLFALLHQLGDWFVGVERLEQIIASADERPVVEMMRKAAARNMEQNAVAEAAEKRIHWIAREGEGLWPGGRVMTPLFDVLTSPLCRQWPGIAMLPLMGGHGGVPRVRARLLDIVLLIDPVALSALGLADAAAEFIDVPLPMRLTVVIAPAASSRDCVECLKRVSMVATGYVLMLGRVEGARQFLQAVLRGAEVEEAIVKAGGNPAMWAPQHHVTHPAVAAMSDYANSRGLPVPSLLVNGKLMPIKAIVTSQRGPTPELSDAIMKDMSLVIRELLTGADADLLELPAMFLPEEDVPATYAEMLQLDVTQDARQLRAADSAAREKTCLGYGSDDYVVLPVEALNTLRYISVGDYPASDQLGEVDIFHILVMEANSEGLRVLSTLMTHLLLARQRKTWVHRRFRHAVSRLAVLVVEDGVNSKTIRACLRSLVGDNAVDSIKIFSDEARLANEEQMKNLRAACEISLAGQVSSAQEMTQEEQRILKTAYQPNRANASSSSSSSQQVSPQSSAEGHLGTVLISNGYRTDQLHLLTAAHVDSLEHFLARRYVAPPRGTSPATATVAAAIYTSLTSRLKDGFALPANVDVSDGIRLRIPSTSDRATVVRLGGLLDPLSRSGQAMLPLLRVLHQQLNADIDVVLNPASVYEDYPLNRWYRQAVAGAGRSSAHFAGLTTSHTLTAALHTPDSWLVTAAEGVVDMDNIRAVEVDALSNHTVEAEYRLSSLFVEGQTFVRTEGLPYATGYQLIGGQQQTTVMGNLGYFQLQANPGTISITARDPQHRQRRLLTAANFSANENSNASAEVTISSFTSSPTPLVVDGHSTGGGAEFLTTLLTAATISGWSFAKQLVQMVMIRSAVCTETVHIFSLASGHMYERLLRIMMLSARKHTTCPLHFWFLDNFLSSQFKRIMPAMALRYSFTFSYVTYKWPSWLRPQVEKQRVIWAYKILFLDVLFPLQLHRIIYIDADQVVRADVKELWEMSLHGRVYGYTPFCDSNEATEAFRFWKSGYWATHLRQHPYHISALYVVDLHAFRLKGAGQFMKATRQWIILLFVREYSKTYV